MNDLMQVVTLQRRRAAELPITKFPATVPDTNRQPARTLHLYPVTCE